jgi:hypothetical protein
VDKWHNEVDEKVKELAAKHHLPQEEVWSHMFSASRLKPQRGYHEFNAKVWRQAEELNKGKSPFICLAFMLT